MVSASLVLVTHAIWINDFDGFVRGIGSMALRQLNHPVYYGFGILSALCLIVVSYVIARLQALSKEQSVFNALGANSIFAYGFGNMLLHFAPAGGMSLSYSLLVSFGFIAFLALMTFDVSHRRPRFFGIFAIGLRHLMTLWRKFIRYLFSRIELKKT